MRVICASASEQAQQEVEKSDEDSERRRIAERNVARYERFLEIAES